MNIRVYGLRILSGVVLGSAMCALGCAESESSAQVEQSAEAAQWIRLDSNEFDDAEQGKLVRAMDARKALETTLKARLMGAIKEGGPANGVAVCSQDASALADEIGEDHKLRIGRTSFKLRNQSNQPPAWMDEVVAERTNEPVFMRNTDRAGLFAAAFPIQIAPPCMVCHGDQNSIAKGVLETIAEHYPDDQATGFGLGDLRGWFWVEIDEE
jgi:hypothetical protein